MLEVYNGQLIAKLYSEKDIDNIIDILREVSGIKDPVFIEPIFDLYQAKYWKSHISHYFINSLDDIGTEYAIKKVTEIFLSPNTKVGDKIWSLESLASGRVFDSFIIEEVKHILYTNIEKVKSGVNPNHTDLNYYNLEKIFRYLKESNHLSSVETTLQDIFLDPAYSRDSKEVILKYLLSKELKPDIQVQFFLDNYVRITNSISEQVLATTLVRWNGTLVDLLREKIRNEGGPRAKVILEKFETDKQKEIDVQNATKVRQYTNVAVITDINELIEKINKQAELHHLIKSKVFFNTGFLLHQLQPAQDLPTLKTYVISIRDFFDSIIYKEGIEIGSLSDEELKRTFPSGVDLKDKNKPLNKLFLSLKLNGFSIDYDLLGLRYINRLSSLLGSHEAERSKLIDILKKENLQDFYAQDNWKDLHFQILILWKSTLENFSILMETNKEIK